MVVGWDAESYKRREHSVVGPIHLWDCHFVVGQLLLFSKGTVHTER